MKVSGFCVMFLAAFMLFNFSSPTLVSWFPVPDFVATTTSSGDKTTLIIVSRKLKENGSGISSNNKDDIVHMTLDDYHPIHPPPGSDPGEILRPRPVEHGSPLNPYIPNPPPPPSNPQ